MILEEDKRILRGLGEKYMGYASLSVQAKKREQWIAHNSRESRRPMVLIDQMPWNELDIDGSLICRVQDPYFKQVEWMLRSEIYKWEHLPVDMVLNPYIEIPRLIEDSGYGVMAQVERLEQGDSGVYAQHFTNMFTEPEDVEKIKDPVVTVDRDGEREKMEIACEIFDGIAEVRFRGTVLHLGLWDYITQCMGVTDCYIELLDRPEMMHAIMERLTQAVIARIEQVNQLGIYDVTSNYCHCSHTFMNELPGPGCDFENPTTHDGWAFGLAQLFSSVSPDITAEFEVPYMQRIFPYFGAIYYGCCEKLDDRLDIIDRMPNIRKISCSPWSDREHFAEVLPKKYIMSNKPNPALLAGLTFEEDKVRQDLRRTISAAKENDLCLEMILKDITTVCHEPERLFRWAEIAREETEWA